ncbi:MAG: alpha/beta hydrolase [Oscillospiraceae bacterium]|nr:alpha/beta hydrolase [Oscillospiraceae bacterium]
MKYKIAEELIPITKLPTPSNPALMPILNRMMGLMFRCKSDEHVSVRKYKLTSFDGKSFSCYVIEPKDCGNKPLPCLVFFHGGGFMLRASGAHYQLAKEYAAKTPCRVIYPDYRLAPKHPFPAPVEDCYASYHWAIEHADKLHIDTERIAIGGDSAGGNLAAAVTLMARDRGLILPKLAMLIYPVADRRMLTQSMQDFTDTPVWNAELSKVMWKAYLGDQKPEHIEYASPLEAASFAAFPESYIEVSEFDCLRDEGIALHERLLAEGIQSQLHRIDFACHGFETAVDSSITRSAMERRIQLLQKAFGVEHER